MPVADPNLEILKLAIGQLGELAREMVFVGGCATGLLVTDPASAGTTTGSYRCGEIPPARGRRLNLFYSAPTASACAADRQGVNPRKRYRYPCQYTRRRNCASTFAFQSAASLAGMTPFDTASSMYGAKLLVKDLTSLSGS